MRREVRQNAGGGRFVVGVDFGTTFTSVAFAHSGTPDDVKMVQSWPNGSTSGESADQVPTEILYTKLGTSREFLWGNEIPPPGKKNPEPFRWFKLLLQNNSTDKRRTTAGSVSDILHTVTESLHALPRIVANDTSTATPAYQTSTRLRQFGMQPATVVEDFLTGVRRVALQNIEDSYGAQFTKGIQTEYIITIPAIWSDSAKGQMVRACEAAGFGKHRANFHLVSEPEAAAAHTLKVIQPQNLKPNDTFIICDAGGGTVDLISYKIRNLQPHLLLDEVVSGSGGLCGSVYLDDGFKEYIERTLGAEVVAKMSVKSRANMEKSWREGVKFRFTSSPQSRNMLFDVAVNGIPDNDDLEIEDGFHTMERESVQAIFDPIVDKIINLVNQQVKAVQATKSQVAAILLVGGFGSSKYLFERLQNAKFGKNSESILVIQPVNAKTAIARGALLRGLDGSCVKDKRSRLFYGLQANGALSEYPAGHSRAYHDKIDRIMRVPGTMFWYINKEDIFNENKTHSQDFRRHVPVWLPNFIFEDDIWGTAQNKAPQFKWETGAEVFKVGTLVSDLTRVPKSTLVTKWGSDGVDYYEVSYTIKMRMLNDVLKFVLVHQGLEYGEATLQFEDQV